MSTFDFYNILNDNNIIKELTGDVELEDHEMIKWSYDCLGNTYEDLDDFLMSIYESDLEIIEDFIDDNDIEKEFKILNPEIIDTIISFSIVES
ncbi:MAG: hypothetical protein ACOC33_03580 [bacterium]